MAIFKQCLAEALGDAAVDLAKQQVGIDHLSEIVDHGIADEIECAGAAVDFDFHDVNAVGISRLPGRELIDLVEGRATALRRRAECDFGKAEAAVGAGNVVSPGFEADVLHRRFEEFRRLPGGDPDQFSRTGGNRGPAHGHRSRPRRAAAPRDDVGVALNHGDPFGIDFQVFAKNLPKRRFVTLAVRHGADMQVYMAIGPDDQPGLFRRAA